MVRESWQGGCRGNADSQGAKYNSTPSYKNRKHKKDKKRQCLWRKPRCGRRRGRRGASTNSSRVEHVHTVPCLALGMGKGLPQPQARLRVPRSGRKKGRERWSKQTQLSQHTCGHLSPEAMVQAAVSSLESSCCHQAPLTAQRERGCRRDLSLPAARPAALGGGGDRLRPFRGQRQGTSMFLQSMKVEPVVAHPRLLTPSRPLNVSHS